MDVHDHAVMSEVLCVSNNNRFFFAIECVRSLSYLVNILFGKEPRFRDPKCLGSVIDSSCCNFGVISAVIFLNGLIKVALFKSISITIPI